MKERIIQIIKEDINPQLALHSGSCELVEVDDGVVILRIFGGCSGCPSSQITLFNSVTPVLRDKVPEIKDILLG